jgi:hypothetical protein
MYAWNPSDPTDYADPLETIYLDSLDIPTTYKMDEIPF